LDTFNSQYQTGQAANQKNQKLLKLKVKFSSQSSPCVPPAVNTNINFIQKNQHHPHDGSQLSMPNIGLNLQITTT